jgi:hypothetical protein
MCLLIKTPRQHPRLTYPTIAFESLLESRTPISGLHCCFGGAVEKVEGLGAKVTYQDVETWNAQSGRRETLLIGISILDVLYAL